MITVTQPAAQQIRQAAQHSEAEGMALRIAARRAPDGAIEYGMGFDDERENDVQVVAEGVTILVSSHSRELLAGAVLDFVELNPGEFQFIFINPNDNGQPMQNQSGGCGGGGCGSGGCGSSGGGCA